MNAYLPQSRKTRDEMLQTIGVTSVDQLLASVPGSLRNPNITLPEPVSEYELEREINERMAGARDRLSFLGAGTYDHYIPSLVSALASRGEFFTAYTPYQAEASQGTLQAIFEFQSLMARLTGMAVCTASHYDGATSLAESVLVTVLQTGRKRVIVADTVHPDYRSVLKTYVKSYGVKIVELPFDAATGAFDRAALAKELCDEVACFVSQSPNFFGVLEDYTGIKDMLHARGVQFVLVVNPMSLALVKSPGEWGADLACGDAQVLGNAMSFGGPHLGFITATDAYLRKVPGRLVGMTDDADGKRAFVLTLQAREQHIRRQRASSNICSNQALCALMTTLYLSAVGSRGLTRIAEINRQNTAALIDMITRAGIGKPVFSGTAFNECVIEVPMKAEALIKKVAKHGIDIGVPLSRWYPALTNHMLVCVTETKGRADLERYVTVVSKAVATVKGGRS